MAALLRTVLMVVLSGIITGARAQDITGIWVKDAVSCDDPSVSLPEFDPIRYSYSELDFQKNGKLFQSYRLGDRGSELRYRNRSGILSIKMSSGYPVGEWQIVRLTEDELVLKIGPRNKSATEADALLHHFIREDRYKKKWGAEPLETARITGLDTVYRSGIRVCPRFTGDFSLEAYCTRLIPEMNQVRFTDQVFSATFVVYKDGTVTDVEISKGITPEFASQFRNAISSTAGSWIPASWDGRAVSMEMEIEFHFHSQQVHQRILALQSEIDQALSKEDYAEARKLYAAIVEIQPEKTEWLYNKTVLDMVWKDSAAACEGLQRLQKSRRYQLRDLMQEHCR